MSRSKAKFRWEDGEDEEDLEFGISRAQLKRDQAEWEVVILHLISLDPNGWALLPLDEVQVEALEKLLVLAEVRRTAFKRQLGFTKGLFRGIDLTEIRDALLEGVQHHPPAVHVNAEAWTKRILNEGDTALMDFVEQHPEADRQLLRPLLRQALKTPKGKAPRKLLLAVKRTIIEA